MSTTAISTWTGTRALGRAGIDVFALGLGGWAIGGPAWCAGKPIGWGAEIDVLLGR